MSQIDNDPGCSDVNKTWIPSVKIAVMNLYNLGTRVLRYPRYSLVEDDSRAQTTFSGLAFLAKLEGN